MRTYEALGGNFVEVASRSFAQEATNSFIEAMGNSFVEVEGGSFSVGEGSTRASGLEPCSFGAGRNLDPENVQHSIQSFLQLPEVAVEQHCMRTYEEPLMDYSKSIMLTSNDYLQSREIKAKRKEKAK